MQCAKCGHPLPLGFPGATLSCAKCGERASIPSPISAQPMSAPRSSGPYRGGATTPADETETICPYCSNRCPALARVCPHCDVRLENVRCGRCYSLQPPGAFNCQRCGQALELEPLLDATDAPCPRCKMPLEAAQSDGAGLHECPRCGGAFVPKEVLAELLTRAELSGPFAEPAKRPILALDQVRYVPCPQCHSSMNRMNFGRVSGVIVDVCKLHGTWFDGGELTRVIAFASSGGLNKTRAREAEEAVKNNKEREKLHSELARHAGERQAHEALDELNHARRFHHRSPAEALDDWRKLLRVFFSW